MTKTHAPSARLFDCLLLALMVAHNALGQQPPPSQPLGSGMTIEELQAKSQQRAPMSAPETDAGKKVPILKPANEPNSRFQYRCYPSPRQIRVGTAGVHFARAAMLFQLQPVEFRSRWTANVEMRDWTEWNVQEVESMLETFAPVLRELDELAHCDDLRWNLRTPDLNSSEAYSILLPEVQQARQLARLLHCDSIIHAKKGRIARSFQSLQAGFRLAEFALHGDTILQHLVALSIFGSMHSAVLACIEIEAFPNAYWALATVPESTLIGMHRAIDYEVSAVEEVLPALFLADRQDIDDAEWERLWRQSRKQFQQTAAEGSSNPLLMLAAVDMDEARKRLKQSGWTEERLNTLPKWRLLAIDMLHDFRIATDQRQGRALLENRVSTTWSDRLANATTKAPQETSLSPGNLFAEQYQPAVDLALSAHRTCQQRHRMLMTMEAIRMHAAAHGGKPPSHLQELDVVPPLLDPSTGNDFEYQVQPLDVGYAVTLSGAVVAAGKMPTKIEFQLAR